MKNITVKMVVLMIMVLFWEIGTASALSDKREANKQHNMNRRNEIIQGENAKINKEDALRDFEDQQALEEMQHVQEQNKQEGKDRIDQMRSKDNQRRNAQKEKNAALLKEQEIATSQLKERQQRAQDAGKTIDQELDELIKENKQLENTEIPDVQQNQEGQDNQEAHEQNETNIPSNLKDYEHNFDELGSTPNQRTDEKSYPSLHGYNYNPGISSKPDSGFGLDLHYSSDQDMTNVPNEQGQKVQNHSLTPSPGGNYNFGLKFDQNVFGTAPSSPSKYNLGLQHDSSHINSKENKETAKTDRIQKATQFDIIQTAKKTINDGLDKCEMIPEFLYIPVVSDVCDIGNSIRDGEHSDAAIDLLLNLNPGAKIIKIGGKYVKVAEKTVKNTKKKHTFRGEKVTGGKPHANNPDSHISQNGKYLGKNNKWYPNDFQTEKGTTQISSKKIKKSDITVEEKFNIKSVAEGKKIIRDRIGKDYVRIDKYTVRSKNGRWQYRAKPVDINDNHIHLEKLDPQTGQVLENYHFELKYFVNLFN